MLIYFSASLNTLKAEKRELNLLLNTLNQKGVTGYYYVGVHEGVLTSKEVEDIKQKIKDSQLFLMVLNQHMNEAYKKELDFANVLYKTHKNPKISIFCYEDPNGANAHAYASLQAYDYYYQAYQSLSDLRFNVLLTILLLSDVSVNHLNIEDKGLIYHGVHIGDYDFLNVSFFKQVSDRWTHKAELKKLEDFQMTNLNPNDQSGINKRVNELREIVEAEDNLILDLYLQSFQKNDPYFQEIITYIEQNKQDQIHQSIISKSFLNQTDQYMKTMMTSEQVMALIDSMLFSITALRLIEPQIAHEKLSPYYEKIIQLEKKYHTKFQGTLHYFYYLTKQIPGIHDHECIDIGRFLIDNLATPSDKTEVASHLARLFERNHQTDEAILSYKRAVAYARMEYELFETHAYLEKYIKVLIRQTNHLRLRYQYLKAEEAYQQIMPLIQKMNFDNHTMADEIEIFNLYNNHAFNLTFIGRESEAILYYEKAIQLAKQWIPKAKFTDIIQIQTKMYQTKINLYKYIEQSTTDHPLWADLLKEIPSGSDFIKIKLTIYIQIIQQLISQNNHEKTFEHIQSFLSLFQSLSPFEQKHHIGDWIAMFDVILQRLKNFKTEEVKHLIGLYDSMMESHQSSLIPFFRIKHSYVHHFMHQETLLDEEFIHKMIHDIQSSRLYPHQKDEIIEKLIEHLLDRNTFKPVIQLLVSYQNNIDINYEKETAFYQNKAKKICTYANQVWDMVDQTHHQTLQQILKGCDLLGD